MFTGIVQRTTPILQVIDRDGGQFRRLTIAPPWTDVRHGESVAINGVCLTVAEIDGRTLAFDVIAETLLKTNLGRLKSSDLVNLERSMRVGDRIDGHFVQGHVDGTARIVEINRNADDVRIAAESPPELARYLIAKGSVCLDGTSLTIAKVDGQRFEVALIPTTLALTTLADAEVGWPLNLEADIFTKTIVSTLERMRNPAQD